MSKLSPASTAYWPDGLSNTDSGPKGGAEGAIAWLSSKVAKSLIDPNHISKLLKVSPLLPLSLNPFPPVGEGL